jgi:C-lobe and N-lobe beta barrels of Tf-binding protein B
MTSAVSLAACAGGGGDSAGGGTLSAAGMRAGVNGVCGIGDTSCIPPDPTGGGTGGTGTGGTVTGSNAGGNNAVISAGNRAIAIERMVYTAPTDAPVARTRLTSLDAANTAATEAAILSNNKPKTLKMEVDTNAGNNSNFAVPVMMNEDIFGTRDLEWLHLGHTNVPVNSIEIYDPNGRAIRFNEARKRFQYFSGGAFTTEAPIDTSQDFYWNQITPFMGSKANGGAGGNYREYAIYSPTLKRDEVLQVWAWDDSYTAQYQNQGQKGSPPQQAWSYGGRATTNMPTGGNATYRGRFVGIAETRNWAPASTPQGYSGEVVNPNALWMVQGSSELGVDFSKTTNQVSGVLKPESWTSEQNGYWYTWQTFAASDPAVGNIAGNPSTPTPGEYDYSFYSTPLNLQGTIVAGDTAGTAPAVNNAIVGTASFGGDALTGDNPMQAGFFGNNATEVTGVFTAAGTFKDPRGGSTGLNDPRRGFVDMNGTFNATCTPGVTCAP